MRGSFRHREGEREIVFGAGAVGAAEQAIGDRYTLLTTRRAAASVPALEARAARVLDVPPGLVEDVAAGLREAASGERLLALGGGRVIDVAKALAAADGPRPVIAVPTSLSAAEMTGMHRHARGVDPATPRVRPSLVVNDPHLSASQPTPALAASAANALAHGLAGLLGDRTDPIASAVAGEGIAAIASSWHGGEPDRPGLALGALLCGWAVDHSGLGLQHVVAQTAVRTAGVGHAQANAAVLPVAAAALRRRRPEALARLDDRLGAPVEDIAARLRERAAVQGLGAIGTDEAALERAVEAALARRELDRIASPPDREELRAIFRAAAAGVHG